jgi:hypothetical protein
MSGQPKVPGAMTPGATTRNQVDIENMGERLLATALPE